VLTPVMGDSGFLGTTLCDLATIQYFSDSWRMTSQRIVCVSKRSSCGMVRMSRICGVLEYLMACLCSDLLDFHEAESDTPAMTTVAMFK
jgi:hypothetical protein